MGKQMTRTPFWKRLIRVLPLDYFSIFDFPHTQQLNFMGILLSSWWTWTPVFDDRCAHVVNEYTIQPEYLWTSCDISTWRWSGVFDINKRIEWVSKHIYISGYSIVFDKTRYQEHFAYYYSLDSHQNIRYILAHVWMLCYLLGLLIYCHDTHSIDHNRKLFFSNLLILISIFLCGLVLASKYKLELSDNVVSRSQSPSTGNASVVTDGRKTVKTCSGVNSFCSLAEQNPWVVVDLGSVMNVTLVNVIADSNRPSNVYVLFWLFEVLNKSISNTNAFYRNALKSW